MHKSRHSKRFSHRPKLFRVIPLATIASLKIMMAELIVSGTYDLQELHTILSRFGNNLSRIP